MRLLPAERVGAQLLSGLLSTLSAQGRRPLRRDPGSGALSTTLSPGKAVASRVEGDPAQRRRVGNAPITASYTVRREALSDG